MYLYGGIYIDCDYEPITSLELLNIPNLYNGFIPLHFHSDDITICNSLFGFKKEHPIIKHIVDNIKSPIWLGPHYLGEYVKDYFKLNPETDDFILKTHLEKLNIKTIHTKTKLREYVYHHFSYTWSNKAKEKMEIDKSFNGI